MNNDFYGLKKEIIDDDLCTRCGTCLGVCPSKCIEFHNEKIIKNENQCMNCGQCMENCPGKYFDYSQYNQQLFNEKYNIKNILGTYKKIYTGHSASEVVRNAAASGGIVSEMAVFLLRRNYVDGVVVVTSNINKQDFDVKIARTEQEVYAAATSKYTIIPTNKIIRVILDTPGKYAYIGLPCQVQGIRKAMSNNKILQNRIYIVIGLFCGFNMSREGTEYLLNKSQVAFNDIIDFSYRKKIGNATGFYVADSTKQYFVRKHEYTFLNLFYSPKRCLMCYDYSAEFSDVSMGDAWEMGTGWSRVVIRNEVGQRILDDMIKSKLVVCVDSDEDVIRNSQTKIIIHKKYDIWYRWKKYKNIPQINIDSLPQKRTIGVMGKIQYYVMNIGHSKLGRKLLYFIPFDLLRKISRTLRK